MSTPPKDFKCFLCTLSLPSDQNEIFETTCHHTFHVRCIRSFLENKKRNECPICNTRFEKNDYDCLYELCEWCHRRKVSIYLNSCCDPCSLNFRTIKQIMIPILDFPNTLPKDLPLDYFLFSHWKQHRNPEKGSEQILLFKDFVLRYARSVSNCVKYFNSDVESSPSANGNFIELLNNCLKYRDVRYEMEFESHEQKIRKDMSTLYATLDDEPLFILFEFEDCDADMETYQRLVMEYANILANLYYYGETVNGTTKKALNEFRFCIVNYENQMLRKALVKFLDKLPRQLKLQFSKNGPTYDDLKSVEDQVDLNKCKEMMVKLKKCYRLFYLHNPYLKY